ncbi:DUF4265 domain-containing protein [Catelliglobosispora koreensis]|uniref:DUF4265 domain-containing protein n=1 Tax=Catelliglobosispora koreensis TaxID=129052 RepID=UPI000476E9FC|nr:DUF4265 domain-containing protein [Catelliglobosispora koreensis]
MTILWGAVPVTTSSWSILSGLVSQANLSSCGLTMTRTATLGSRACRFRVYGLALRDQVALNANKTTITRLAQRSGHRLLRLVLAKTLPPAERLSLRQEFVGAISANGALAEWSGRWHLAVDVPPESSIDFVERIVTPHLETEGVYWEWADAEHFN